MKCRPECKRSIRASICSKYWALCIYQNHDLSTEKFYVVYAPETPRPCPFPISVILQFPKSKITMSPSFQSRPKQV